MFGKQDEVTRQSFLTRSHPLEIIDEEILSLMPFNNSYLEKKFMRKLKLDGSIISEQEAPTQSSYMAQYVENQCKLRILDEQISENLESGGNKDEVAILMLTSMNQTLQQNLADTRETMMIFQGFNLDYSNQKEVNKYINQKIQQNNKLHKKVNKLKLIRTNIQEVQRKKKSDRLQTLLSKRECLELKLEKARESLQDFSKRLEALEKVQTLVQ